MSAPHPPASNPLDAWTAAVLGRPGAGFTRADLHIFQTARLRETVTWAQQRSPFYRRHLADIDVAALTMPEGLRQLPFTTADDLRRNDPPLLCVSQDEIARVVTLETSGTCGVPKRVYFTRGDQEATIEFFHHGMCLPTRPGERVMILFPGERPGSVGDLLATAVRRLGATPIVAGWPYDPAAMAALLRRERPEVVAGAPVAALSVACHAAATGPGALHVRRVLLSADNVARSLRRRLTDLWACEIFEHYGMTEMGLGGGVDCEAHAGYHMRESALAIEIVDPVSGEPLPPGETGEVVFTTLTRRGMPLIRYRSGDLSRVLPSGCRCGSPLLRLERIHRRVNAGVLLDGDRLLTQSALDEALFAVRGVTDFSTRFRPGAQPAIAINIVVTPNDDSAELRAAVRAALHGVPALATSLAAQRIGLELAVTHGAPATGKRSIGIETKI